MIEDEILSRVRESKRLEFKRKFEVESKKDWCDLIKHVVAMANSGGGVIVVGVEDNGDTSNYSWADLLTLDPADLTNNIAKYTGEHFGDFEIIEVKRGRKKVGVVKIGGSEIPMVFIKPGEYEIGEKHEKKFSFAKGTIYFRHGAKSEPGTSADIVAAINREVERRSSILLKNVRKVVNAPAGHAVKVIPPEVIMSNNPDAFPVRVVDNPGAPVLQIQSQDTAYPYRQVEVRTLFNRHMQSKKINSRDILAVRRVFKIDSSKPQYFYHPKFGSPQYSQAFIDWLIREYENDPSFFDKARERLWQTEKVSVTKK